MKVLCINAKNKPNDIQNKNWVVEGEEYTVLKLLKNTFTKEQYYSLAEVKPDAPYGGYKVNRFAIPENELEKYCIMFNLDYKFIKKNIDLLLETLVEESELEIEKIDK